MNEEELDRLVLNFGSRNNDRKTKEWISNHFKDKAEKQVKCPFCGNNSMVGQINYAYDQKYSYYWCFNCNFSIGKDNLLNESRTLELSSNKYLDILEKISKIKEDLSTYEGIIRLARPEVVSKVVVNEL